MYLYDVKHTISKSYLKYRPEILEIIENFEGSGSDFLIGDRNRIKRFTIDDITINAKSFKVPNAINKIMYRFFRKSKAKRSFENAQLLQKNGVGTPNPIAFFELYKGPFFGKSYYLSEHFEADLLYKDLLENKSYPDREKIIRSFVHFTHRLHELQILFKDHSPGNTLIKKKGAKYSFFLVDLNRMKFKSLSFKERVTNFTRLTPHKEMIATMSDEYSKITGHSYDKIFDLMWGLTEKFQKKFYRKIALKNKYLFWRKKRK